MGGKRTGEGEGRSSSLPLAVPTLYLGKWSGGGVVAEGLLCAGSSVTRFPQRSHFI